MKIARQQFVRLGVIARRLRRDHQGPQGGPDEVVSAGAFKLRNNAPVFVDNSVQPKPQLARTPPNR